jgi:glycosyltransferase involved in cell wall biosynthesis
VLDSCDKKSKTVVMRINSLGSAKVCILLCTFNGGRFLSEQLDSLAAQTHQNWLLIASDDGSTDDTLQTLQSYQAKWPNGKLIIKEGPRQGFCGNFLSLACDPSIKADYYAFCDQDDVWLPTKLEVAVNNIAAHQVHRDVTLPYLYCGRTTYVSENLEPIGISPLFVFPAKFRNALVQSIAGGNTMVFNQITKLALEKVGIVDVPSHDWWLYLLVSGMGGEVYYDKVPQILYRQHDDSIVGENRSFGSKCFRAYTLLRGRFRNWNTKNIAALCVVKDLLTEDNQEILRLFKLLRSAQLIDRFRLMEVCGLYRQTWRGTMTLFLAALLKKI